MLPALARCWRHRDGAVVRYLLATALPLGVTILALQLAMPAFAFEHLVVLLVVAMAVLGGRGPAILAAVVASIGDNVLLREPIGRPAIEGFRDLLDFGLFLAVAATVGWLVQRMREATKAAIRAAERERLAREQRDQLVATVTHDLVTPLGVIQNTIHVVRRHGGVSSLDLPRLLVRIDTAAARATSLVRTLRDVRSLEDDSLSLDIQRADLRTIVESTVTMLDRLSDRHPLLLTTPEVPLFVDCDVERVGRVVENLVTNAIKYSPDGGPVDVSVFEADGLAVVRVEDGGIGIPAAHRERMFEPGYRTADAAAVASGLGLGLYIAAAIVRQHGGTLDASPRERGGSVFTVRLPLVGSSHSAAAGAASRRTLAPPCRYAS